MGRDFTGFIGLACVNDFTGFIGFSGFAVFCGFACLACLSGFSGFSGFTGFPVFSVLYLIRVVNFFGYARPPGRAKKASSRRHRYFSRVIHVVFFYGNVQILDSSCFFKSNSCFFVCFFVCFFLETGF